MPKPSINPILSVFLLLALSCFGFSQNDSLAQGTTLPFKVLKTTDDALTINDIIKSKHPFNYLSHFAQKTHPDDFYWIRIDFEKELAHLQTSNIWHLKFNSFDYGKLLYQHDGTIQEKPIGKFDPHTQSEKVKANKYFSEISFDSGTLIQDRYLYLKVRRVTFFEQLQNWEISYQQQSIKNIYSWDDFKALLPIYIFTGVSGIMSLLVFLFFIYLRRMEFFLNSFYVFWLLVFIFKEELLLYHDLFTDNELLKNWMLENLVIVIALGYMLFMIFYLNLRKEYPFAFKVLQVSISIHLLILVADAFFYYFEFFVGRIYILEIVPILDSTTAFLSVGYIFLFNKNLLTTFFILGSVTFMVGVGCFFYLDTDSDPLNYNKLYIIIGSILEITIFALGLTYKIFMENTERLKFQEEAFINKTKALRAQINPHFIFNSLNSIQHLITKNNKVSALKYLSKFGRLTRNILESSFETNAKLDDEIKLLTDYLELESLRFDNAFTYKIQIDEALIPEEIEMPFMILQPFVENAIIHGLLPKKGDNKELLIRLKKESDFMVCEVEDNGVGRQMAKLRLHIYQKEKKSRGLEVTKQRLESIGENPENLQIIDKVDEENNPLGTKVIIRIPI
ncbi:sensor histidine kinase [Flagellimonas sp. S3867]|uniref:sensor histidine kinase n=1 Tax=Flagellimonas sp. S3867 TaxID=2768063 RepID=UPI001684E9C4|nr:histidine kinase [Flagellimonas sp. S3867]